MTKRVQRKYKLLRFYQEDLWGRLSVSANFKKVKINKLLKEIRLEKTFFRREIEAETLRLKKKFGVLDLATMRTLSGKAKVIAWRNYRQYKSSLFDLSLSRFSFSKFSEFSVEEFILSEVFDGEGLFNSRDWRLSHMKFRVFLILFFCLKIEN